MKYTLILATLIAGSVFADEPAYTVVGTGQTKCYGDRGEIISLRRDRHMDYCPIQCPGRTRSVINARYCQAQAYWWRT